MNGIRQRAILVEIGRKIGESIAGNKRNAAYMQAVLDRLTPEQRQEFHATWEGCSDWKTFLDACSNGLLRALSDAMEAEQWRREEVQE